MLYIKIVGDECLKLDLEYKSGVLFIRLEGKLVRKTNHKIYNYIIPVIMKHKIKYIIYNLSNLINIDESGIDAILSSKCKIKMNKGEIYLCNIRKELMPKLKRLRIKNFSDELTAFKKIEVNM